MTAGVVTGVRLSAAVLLGLTAIAALTAGALAAVQPMYAVALVLAAALAVVVASNIHALPALLVFTMFVEDVALGPGLRVGRLVGGMALLALLYYVLARGRVRLRANLLLTLAGAYGFWHLASVLWADASGPAYTNLLSFLLALAYMFTLAVLVRTPRQLAAVLATLAIGSLVFGAIAFATYARSGAGAAGDDLRATGLAGDPNYFAVYQVAALPAILALAAGEARHGRRLLLYAAVMTIVLSVASTLSRTGLIALTLVILGTLALPWRAFFRRPGDKVKYAAAIAVSVLAAVAVGSTAFVERAHSILEPGRQGDRGSGRTDLYAAALSGWREEPWLGLGSGNFSYHSLRLLQTTPGVDTTRNYVREGRVAHNAYLETLAELGIAGLALFLGLIGTTARYLVLAYRRAKAAGEMLVERVSLALLVSLLGYSASAFFLSNQLGKLLWVIVGLTLAVDVISRSAAPAAQLVRAPDAEAEPEPEYDLDVREQLVEQRERRLAGEYDAIRAERARLERLQRTLEARLEELERRTGPLPEVREAAGETIAVREQELNRRVATVTQRERELARRYAELTRQEAELDELRRSLSARPAAPAAPVAPPAAPARVEAEPVPAVLEPAPVPVAAEPPPAPPPAVLAVRPSSTGAPPLPDLERLVTQHAAEFPVEAEEWRYYLVYLRDYADVDGNLPPQFDSLVFDVFAPLLERR